MTFSSEFWLAVSIGAVAFLFGALMLGRYAKRTRSVGRSVNGGPSNLRFKCRGCSGQFTHSRRTLSGYDKGNRAFLCNACLTRARGVPPPAPGAKVPKASAKRR